MAFKQPTTQLLNLLGVIVLRALTLSPELSPELGAFAFLYGGSIVDVDETGRSITRWIEYIYRHISILVI